MNRLVVPFLVLVLLASVVTSVWGAGQTLAPGLAALPASDQAVLAQTTPGAPASAPAAPATDDWTRIRNAGRMLVGTSADYPPFDYYNDSYQFDGFDIALMREVGKKLGVQVAFIDYAFEALPSALQARQVDVAAAAISITSERQQVADFTNVYFVGEDAVLARTAMTATIGSPRDMAQYRVGVQRGSIYAKWAQTTLVDTGLMPSENLFEYAQPDHAVRDLKDQRVDLVIMDGLAAQTFVNQGGVKIIARSVNQERLAFMLRKGSTSLLAKLNEALVQLQNEGKIAALSKQYLNVVPAMTPTPAASPTPAIPCDMMTFIIDLNYNDYNMTAPPVMKPGQPFTKGWRLRNTGSCTWTSAYQVAFAYGNVSGAQMSGQPTAIKGPVAPGATTDVYVNLVAPTQWGTYQGFWELRNAQGQPFGPRFWVGIQVPNPSPPTPAPTQTPSAGISFTVDRTQIKAGECVTFRWDVEGIKAVYFYPEGESWEDHGVTGHESRQVCPGHTTTYYLRVVKQDGSVETRSITIYVEGGGTSAPDIRQFDSKPGSPISAGTCLELRWDVQGEVDRVTISADGRMLWDYAPTKGKMDDCPSGDSVTYRLKAEGPSHDSSDEHYVDITD